MSSEHALTVSSILGLADIAGGCGTVDAPPMWMHGRGIFGGFTASLALATAARQTGLETIAAAQVMFARAIDAGPVEIRVEVIRRGSTSAAVHVRVRQEELDRVLVQAWLVDEPIEIGERESFHVSMPDSCPVLESFDGWAFMQAIDMRAIDYPVSLASFLGGPPCVDLWVRASRGSTNDSLAGQLLDIIALDAHLVDAALRPHRTGHFIPASLDLNVCWSSTAHTEWRRVRAEAAGPGHRLAPTTGAVWAPDGTVRARASQLARIAVVHASA